MPKVALLSNVNMNYVIRLLQKHVEMYEAEGYGNELGVLLNPSSSYHAFAPEFTFVVMDLMELLEHDLEVDAAKRQIEGWFADLEGALKPEVGYYISDACLWGAELEVAADAGLKINLEHLWQEGLEALCRAYGNVHVLPYRHMLEAMGGEAAFSPKMWYMGKILLGNEAQRKLCGLILDKVRIQTYTPKKVLILDLDNTLWGGLAGENDHTPVRLSEDHEGLAYKNLQRVILQMQKQGVLLAVVSKNNEADAMGILEGHPHMALRPASFAAMRINWSPKHENIREIARELNLGTDSFVFWDDSPGERLLVKELLPEVAVPDYPDQPERLAAAMAEVYREYFAKPSVTEEDRNKTIQYAANAERIKLQDAAGSFEDYLRKLEIVVTRVDPKKHMERLLQLMNKTNQFNLTTRRYTQAELAELLEDGGKRIYLYGVSDRFGDNGIVAAAVADCGAVRSVSLERDGISDRGGMADCGAASEAGGMADCGAASEAGGMADCSAVPVLEDFVMSCRVMGRNIEYAIAEDIEADLRESGYRYLRGRYIPTGKNEPVAGFYERLGYERVDMAGGDGIVYEIGLACVRERMYYVRMGRG